MSVLGKENSLVVILSVITTVYVVVHLGAMLLARVVLKRRVSPSPRRVLFGLFLIALTVMVVRF